MFHARHAIKVTGLSYRQLDNVVRNRLLRPSRGAAHGRGTVRSFSERDLVALRLTKQILGARHRLGPFMHILKFVQHGRELPALDKLEGKVLVSNGIKVHVVDGAGMNLSTTLEARSVVFIVDLGGAVHHVQHGIERITRKTK